MVQKRGKVKSHPAKFVLFISQSVRMSGRWLYGAVHDQCSTGCSSSSHLSLPSSYLTSLFFPFLWYSAILLFHFVLIFWLDICFHVLPYLIGVARLVDFEGNPILPAAHGKKVSVVRWDWELMQLLVWELRCKRDWRSEIWFSGDEDDSLCFSGTPLWGPCNELENECHPL